jgi:hypothetical protein
MQPIVVCLVCVCGMIRVYVFGVREQNRTRWPSGSVISFLPTALLHRVVVQSLLVRYATMSRRRVGIAALQQRTETQDQFRKVGSELSAQEMDKVAAMYCITCHVNVMSIVPNRRPHCAVVAAVAAVADRCNNN